jgi:photosystem II stability/assembly factor-like uncharacterized protein
VRRLAWLALFLVVVVSAACGGRDGNDAASVAAATRPAAVPEDFRIVSATFVSADRGFVLGTTGCQLPSCTVLLATNDGGRTWERATAPPAPVRTSAPTGDGIQALRFANPNDGWAFGGALFSTHDGGGHWGSVPLGLDGVVVDVAPARHSVYALDEACNSAGGQCQLGRLLRSPVAREAFGPTRPPLRLGLPGHLFAGTLAVHGRAVYLLAQVDGRRSLYVSAKRAWLRRPAPCRRAVEVAFAAGPAGELALVCAGEPSAGQQRKRAFASSDAGALWRRLADPPGAGYVAGLAVPAPGTFVLACARGGILVSRNGGRSWEAALEVGPGDGWRELVFATARDGVALPYAAPSGSVPALAVTHDGGRSWSLLHVRVD